MPWRKTFTAKDGRVVILRDQSRRDTPRKLMEFINSFVEEKAYLLADKKYTLKEEKEWVKSCMRQMRKKESIDLIMEHDGRIIGKVDARRDRQKLRGNVLLGIAIKPEFRGEGLGYFAMKELIYRVKKEMKPANIYLTVISANNTAKRLYRKLGFKKHHTLKNWVNHYGAYLDEDFMILGK